jgi:hypothetical protein
MKKAATHESLEALANDNNFKDIQPHLHLSSEAEIRKSIKQSKNMFAKV